MFDKPDELLREKENLLQAQWKLDETKQTLEKQILDREKFLDNIENLLRSNRDRCSNLFILDKNMQISTESEQVVTKRPTCERI